MQRARMMVLGAVNQAIRNHELNASLMDPVLTSVLADIRAQANAELIIDMNSILDNTEGQKESDE